MTTESMPPLPDAAFTIVHNPKTMERQASTHGVAYYGSNWRVERECYTAAQMHAYAKSYAAQEVAKEREACARLSESFVWWEADNCSPDEGNKFIAALIRSSP